jgi:predicted lipase
VPCSAAGALGADRPVVPHAQSLYLDLRTQYPDATVWFTGHSLGGSLASLLAFDAGSTAFCYEAPGERLYAERLGFSLDRDDMAKYRTWRRSPLTLPPPVGARAR